MLDVRSEYTIRQYRTGDENEINDLFNMVFMQNRPLNLWNWQFRDNPAGSANLVTIAKAAGKIIGHYANLPVYFKYIEKTVKAAHPVDNLIHQDYRGSKLIRDMFQYQFMVAKKNDISFGFGMPNEIYYPVGKRYLKYKDLSALSTLFKRLNWRLSFEKRVPKSPSSFNSAVQQLSAKLHRLPIIYKGLPKKNISVRMFSSFDAGIDRLWEKAKDRYGIMAIRNSGFLKWRYIDKPHDAYKILVAYNEEPLGYIVAKVERKDDHLIGYIVDILTVSKDVDNLLIGSALDYFISKKADYCLCRILKEDETYNVLSDYGFAENEAFSSTPVVYHLFKDEIDTSFFKNPGNWHLTYGDQLDLAF